MVVIVGAIALWLKFLGYLKNITHELATFVLMVGIIVKDVKEFVLETKIITKQRKPFP